MLLHEIDLILSLLFYSAVDVVIELYFSSKWCVGCPISKLLVWVLVLVTAGYF